MNKLRYLNFDDLFLLKFLTEGMTLTAAAKELKLTQPAVTQRIKKIEGIFGVKIISRSGRNINLTQDGQSIAANAVDALQLMGEVASVESQECTINLGTRPEAGRSWLWPAVANIRKQHPHFTFHMSFGSGEEVLRQLGADRLDAVLTSAPLTSKSFSSINVAKERYVFVAAPKIAKTVRNIADLESHLLIEHDRSFPFTRYIEPNTRKNIRYKDVWFLESTEIMAQALCRGSGVGIIPEYLAQKYLNSRKLEKLHLKVPLMEDHFRIVYRNQRRIEEPIKLLSAELKKIGLR